MTPSVCIVGAGAIGGWLAAVLDRAGWDVRLLARGRTLTAIKAQGLRVRDGDEERTVRVRASEDPSEIGAVDYVILAVKNQDLVAVAGALEPLLDQETAVVTAMNGLQWWFGQSLPALADAAPLRSIDPGGDLAARFPIHRVIGCVVHATAATTAPGQVQVLGTDRLIFGEPDGRESPRVDRLAQACRDAGVETEVSGEIRLAIWRKLWGNMSMNPLSALTRASTGRLLDDPLTRELVRAMMNEMSDLGDRLGLPLGITPEERMQVTRRLGDFKTSMQRDAEAGRRLELDALLGVLVELADRLTSPAPTLSAVYGLARQLDRSLLMAAAEG